MKMTITKMLLVLSGSLCVMTLIVGGLGHRSLNEIADSYNYILDNHTAKRRLTQQMLINIAEMRILSLNFAFETDGTKIEGLKKEIRDEIKTTEDLLKTYSQYSLDQGEKALLDQLNREWGTYQSETQSLIKAVDLKDSAEIKRIIEQKQKDARQRYATASYALFDFHNGLVQKKNKASDQLLEKTNLYLTIIVLGAFLIAGMFALYLSKKIKQQLSLIVGKISDSVIELSSSGQQLSSSSQQQASSVEEISSSLEEITGMMSSTIKNNKNILKLSERINVLVADGSDSMKQLNNSVQDIAESNKQVEELVRLIEEIGEKTQLIDEIVFQTRLLSFNASVEAERAGEHGRGFAVVAQEVGSLAQMSGKSATEISQIVKNSIKQARSVVETNRSRVDQGVSACNETSQKLEQISKNTSEILGGINEVSRASEEQGAGINQISQSIQLISQTVQENATSAEECSASGQKLVQVVNELEELVGMTKEGLKNVAVMDTGHSSKVIPLNKKKSTLDNNTFKKAAGSEFDAWDKL